MRKYRRDSLSLLALPPRVAALIKSLHSVHGGYKSKTDPHDVTLCAIMKALEGKTCAVLFCETTFGI
jgi:DNA-binding IscR family transcriptional regulator